MGIVSGGSGGAAGGALTPPVAITGTDPNTVPFTVKAAAAQNTEILEVQDSTGSDVLDIDRLGQFFFTGPLASGSHIFRARSGDGTTAIDVTDDGTGIVDTTKLGGLTVDLAPSVDTRIRGTRIGFFGAASVAQRTLVSGTATPEQIALALQASTLMAGT